MKTMKAMVLEKANHPLRLCEMPIPEINPYQVLLKVHSCGVCRTDLHIIDGDLKHPKLPLIPGHEIIGTVVKSGSLVTRLKEGDRIGVPWLGYTCGKCPYCLKGQENLCDNALFTGYTINGGYAEYTAAYEKYCFKIPENYDDNHAAPLLCAGLIGYRSYKKSGENAKKLGLFGFGAAAHILLQIANFQRKEVFTFSREGDLEALKLAKQLGAYWAGYSAEVPIEKLDAAIIFAPIGSLIPNALKMLDKGGCIICGGIHMTDIPSFPYNLLWEERSIASVANLTRSDGEEFFQIASSFKIKTTIHTFPFTEANSVLDMLREGRIHGAAVLTLN